MLPSTFEEWIHVGQKIAEALSCNQATIQSTNTMMVALGTKASLIGVFVLALFAFILAAKCGLLGILKIVPWGVWIPFFVILIILNPFKF